MKQIQKILFPINFAENFETLLPWVTTFADKFGATLYVLYVTQDLEEFASFHVPHGNIQDFQEQAVKAAQEKMGATAKEFFKHFPKLKTRVAAGKPAEKILEIANQEGVDLIIMGTHGRKGLEYTIFGSVCREVIRGAPCPVLSINPQKV